MNPLNYEYIKYCKCQMESGFIVIQNGKICCEYCRGVKIIKSKTPMNPKAAPQGKEYLKFYIGCECEFTTNLGKTYRGKLTGFPVSEDIKLVLRPLSDMSEEERLIVAEIIGVFTVEHFITAWTEKRVYSMSIHNMPELFTYLLSKGFDLFGLKEKGLCVYKNETN